mgnify:CR=1 FL=1
MKLGEVAELQVSELDEKVNVFSDLTVRLPENLSSGNWQMIVRVIDGTEHVIPIPIRVSRKNEK